MYRTKSGQKRKKTRSKPGKRYPFLMYRRTMDRLWGITLLLGLVMLGLWWYGSAFTSLYRTGWVDRVILIAWIVCLGISAIAFFGRRLSYVQANADHFVIRTPFIKLKTSYKRIIEIRSAEFHKLFDAEQFSWAERTYLDPFIGDTAVVIHLRAYPLSPNILKFFFSKFIFSPRETGFVIMVPDWMAFSLEMDSRFSTYLQKHSPQRKGSGFQRGMYRD
ncbi:MAG TPA: hypothetical protein VI451_22510 [Anaerolineales bacterium]|nr:hypothetical protein [Anaerolineales bacterium]